MRRSDLANRIVSLGTVSRDPPPHRFVVATIHLGRSTRAITAEHGTAPRATPRCSVVNTMLVRAHQPTFAPIFFGHHALRKAYFLSHATAFHVGNPAFCTLGYAPISPARTEKPRTNGGPQTAFAELAGVPAPRRLQADFPTLLLSRYNSTLLHGVEGTLIHSCI
jgi:hypothetical protein